jgi:hypothetical protein
MSVAREHSAHTEADYLQLERSSEFKSEYVDGLIATMTAPC